VYFTQKSPFLEAMMCVGIMIEFSPDLVEQCNVTGRLLLRHR